MKRITMPRLSSPAGETDEEGARQSGREPLQLEADERRREARGREPRGLDEGVRVARLRRVERGEDGRRVGSRSGGGDGGLQALSAWPDGGAPETSSSASTSSTSLTRIAPSLRRAFVPAHPSVRIGPGTAATSRPKSAAYRAVIREPLFSAASTTRTSRESPAMIRFRIGK